MSRRFPISVPLTFSVYLLPFGSYTEDIFMSEKWRGSGLGRIMGGVCMHGSISGITDRYNVGFLDQHLVNFLSISHYFQSFNGFLRCQLWPEQGRSQGGQLGQLPPLGRYISPGSKLRPRPLYMLALAMLPPPPYLEFLATKLGRKKFGPLWDVRRHESKIMHIIGLGDLDQSSLRM
jgi:hypothetical protein